MQVDRQNSEVPYYADDEDANRKKYSRRGLLSSFSAFLNFRHYFLSDHMAIQVNSSALFDTHLCIPDSMIYQIFYKFNELYIDMAHLKGLKETKLNEHETIWLDLEFLLRTLLSIVMFR